MPAVFDPRIGLPLRWDSWAAWREAQKPRVPRRNVWVRRWLVVLGQPITYEWVGWESWRHWKFGQRAPEHVGYRTLTNHQGAA